MQWLRRLFQNSLDIYTDGSWKAGRGAWAFVIVRRGQIVFESSGTARRTTSNRMEFQAAIEAMKHCPVKQKLILHTDSRVLLEAIAKIPDWKESGWVKAKGSPIPSVDQMQELYELMQGRPIEWRWVKAHSGLAFNERCDELCSLARA